MFTPELLVSGLGWYAVFVFSTCLHEAAHAWVAWRLGDPTAHRGGQVSLNPLPHIRREPFGMVLVPILSFVLNKGQWMIGWASAPYDPRWAAQYPRRSALMALAGPAANLALALVTGILLRVGLQAGWFVIPDALSMDRIVAAADDGVMAGVAMILSLMFMLNLMLFVFNMMPVPPMDGSGAIPLILSRQAAGRYMEFIHQPGLLWIGLIVAWNLFPKIFVPVWAMVMPLLYHGV